jgi:hypothetical protein
VHTCNLSTCEAEIGRSCVGGQPGIHSKILSRKEGRRGRGEKKDKGERKKEGSREGGREEGRKEEGREGGRKGRKKIEKGRKERKRKGKKKRKETRKKVNGENPQVYHIKVIEPRVSKCRPHQQVT